MDEKIYANEESIGEDAIVDFSSGLRLVYESGEGGIKVWHFGKPHAYKSNYQPISFPNTVSFASDGKTLVVEYRAKVVGCIRTAMFCSGI